MSLLHFRFTQHCFRIPFPPNFGLSEQERHFPQSLALQPEQIPHRLRLCTAGVMITNIFVLQWILTLSCVAGLCNSLL